MTGGSPSHHGMVVTIGAGQSSLLSPADLERVSVLPFDLTSIGSKSPGRPATPAWPTLELVRQGDGSGQLTMDQSWYVDSTQKLYSLEAKQTCIVRMAFLLSHQDRTCCFAVLREPGKLANIVPRDM